MQDDDKPSNDGSGEDPQPEVIGWRGPDDAFYGVTARAFDAGDVGRWQLLIRPVAETVTNLTLSTEAAL